MRTIDDTTRNIVIRTHDDYDSYTSGNSNDQPVLTDDTTCRHQTDIRLLKKGEEGVVHLCDHVRGGHGATVNAERPPVTLPSQQTCGVGGTQVRAPLGTRLTEI